MNLASINVKGGVTPFCKGLSSLSSRMAGTWRTTWRSLLAPATVPVAMTCGLADDLRFVMPRGDPCWTLLSYINFALWTNGSMRTANPFSHVSQHDPEPSQPPPRLAEPEPESRATEPSPLGVTAQEITTEPKPIESDQVREPATMPATVDVPVGREGAEDSTAHCTAEVSPPLSPDSPAAHPQSTICAVGSPRVCQSPSASWLEDPSSPPPAFESWTPPRPFDPAAPPRLSAPSSPLSPVGPPAPSGSIVPPVPPWSVVVPPSPQDSTPPAAPCRSVPPTLLGSFLPQAPPQSSVTPALLRTSGSPPLPQSPEPWAPPWPSGSSVWLWIIGSPSPPQALLSLLSPPWLLPPSDPPWTLLSPPWLLPPSSPPWTLFVVLLPGVCPPPEPPPTLTFLLPSLVHSFVFVFLWHKVSPSGRGV
ncbi:hypothetical protein M9458_056016 [Cirrhinus mrigala]|uniref:Uncharacterized protein n=1 Tax=Cirrhinus mrigala TaxID=683832 RepID=A0ABD0MIF2_CIRMR